MTHRCPQRPASHRVEGNPPSRRRHVPSGTGSRTWHKESGRMAPGVAGRAQPRGDPQFCRGAAHTVPGPLRNLSRGGAPAGELGDPGIRGCVMPGMPGPDGAEPQFAHLRKRLAPLHRQVELPAARREIRAHAQPHDPAAQAAPDRDREPDPPAPSTRRGCDSENRNVPPSSSVRSARIANALAATTV